MFIIIIILFLIILCLIFKQYQEMFFGGLPTTKEKLNKTLIQITKDLNEYKIENWFIAYGTLLGIVRNDSCIEGDDDVDIIISKNESEKLHKLIKDKGYKYSMKFTNFTRIVLNDDLGPIDFYIAIKKNNDYNDTWEKLTWTNVNPILKKKWNGVNLNLPNNFINKLEILYISIYKKFKRGEYKTVHQRKIKIIT